MTELPKRPLRLRILGGPILEGPDGAGVDLAPGKPMAVLAFLALHPEGVHRDTLTRVFWPDRPAKRARASLRQALFILRATLGADLLVGRDRLFIAKGQFWTDLDEVESALDDGDATAAAQLWTEPPLVGFPAVESAAWDHWCEEVRERSERRLVSALLSAGEARFREGAVAAALESARHAIRVAPWSEAGVRLAFEAFLALREFGEAEKLAAAWSDSEGAEDLLARIRRLQDEASVQAEGEPTLAGESFIGRKDEFAQLVSHWRSCQRGAPRASVITGEAGIGKSRLAGEVIRLAVAEGARVATIKGEFNASGVDFGAFGDLARQLLGMEGAAGISLGSHRTLAKVLPSLVKGQQDLPTLPPEPGLTEAGYADALLDLISAVAEERPLAILLDDFGWCDPASRRSIARAIRGLKGLPVLTVVTTRGGERHPEPGSLEALDIRPSDNEAVVRHLLPDAEWIGLGPWTRGDVVDLLEARFPGIASDQLQALTTLLREASHGHPYFTLELLEMLGRKEVVQAIEDGKWTVNLDRLPLPSALPRRLEEILDASLLSLPPDAARLAGHLSLTRHPPLPSTLGVKAGMRERRVSRALAALFEQRIVRWTDDAAVVFIHDEVRTAAYRLFGPLVREDQARLKRRRTSGAWGLAAAVMISFVVGMHAYLSADAEEASVPRFGGGELVLSSGQGFVRIIPTSGPVAEWDREPFDPGFRFSGNIQGPFLSPTGDVQWFRWETEDGEKPWISRVTGVGRETFFRSDGDDYLEDVSADGTLAVIASQRIVPTGEYRMDLHLQPVEGGPSTRIYEGVERLIWGRISPSGNRVAMSIPASPDTLAILKPSGEIVQRVPVPTIESLSWCGDQHLVAILDGAEPERLVEINAESGAIRTLPVEGFASRPTACSPDGSAIVYGSAIQGELALVLQDRRSGEVELLDAPDGVVPTVHWLPPEPRFRPVGAEIELPEEVEWGAAVEARLIVRNAAGASSRPQADVTWSSSDPNVAAITPQGVVLANATGKATITAVWDGWLIATMSVAVSGSVPEGGILQDDFTLLNLERWSIMGSPPPRLVTRDGEPALLLAGDALYHDGLVERQSRAYPRGVTVEVAVRIPLTRRDKQWFRLCLLDGELPAEADRGFEIVDLEIRQNACFLYPNTNLGSFDASLGRLLVRQGPILTLHLHDHFPSEDWVQVSLQVRANGMVSAYANQTYLGSAPLRLRDMQSARWRLMLVGSSWETEVLVKNLRVWEGARY